MGLITSYCRIRNGSIISNSGTVVIDGETTSLEDFLMKSYDRFELNYPKYYKMDNLSRLGLLASEVVITKRSLRDEYGAEKVGVILSNAHGSLDTDLRYYESTKKIASPALFVYTLPNIVTGEICIRNVIKGENAFFVWEAFDTAFMASYVEQVLADGMSACLAGWVDVLEEHYDVFLYLVEKSPREGGRPNTAAELEQLYRE